MNNYKTKNLFDVHNHALTVLQVNLQVENVHAVGQIELDETAQCGYRNEHSSRSKLKSKTHKMFTRCLEEHVIVVIDNLIINQQMNLC